jgi:DNA-binding phage protein
MGPVPARSYREPIQFTERGGTWPNGPWRSDTPAYALVTAALVVRVRQEIGQRSIRDLARDAGIGHATLSRLLAGKVVPDIATVAALEDTLGADLRPTRGAR